MTIARKRSTIESPPLKRAVAEVKPIQRTTSVIIQQKRQDEGVKSTPPPHVTPKYMPQVNIGDVAEKIISSMGSILSMNSVSMSKDTGETYVMGYDGKIEKKSYIEKLNTQNFSTSNNIELVAVLLSMLSNEYALSAGLGRLEGTPLGQSFGSQGSYIQNFLGANGIIDSSNETSSAASQSLADYIIVNELGSNRVNSNNKKVLLLDGTSSKDANNSIDMFVNSVIKNPTTNNINSLEFALSSAISRFDAGLDFYKKLHLRDVNPDLLTPRGLFVRVMKDAATAMGSLSGDGGSKQTIKELALLSVISRLGKNQNNKNHPVNVIKRIILSFLVRKTLAVLLEKNFDSTSFLKVSESKNVKKNSPEPSSQLEKAALDALKKSNKTISENDKILSSQDRIRFSSDDSIMFDNDANSKIISESMNAIFEFELSAPDSNKKEIIFSIGDVLEQSLNDNTSVLSKIVQIFLDVHSEALSSSKKENKNSTFLNSIFLTKNSQIDGTLSLGILLDSMSLIFETFVDASIPNNEKNKFANNESVNFVDGYASIIFEVLMNTKSKTEKARKAIMSICSASQSNNLSSLYTGENENVTIPDLDNEKPGVILSVSGNVSFQSIVEIIKNLSIERDFPAICLASAKAMFDFSSHQAMSILEIGKQLRNDIQRNDKAKAYVDFYEKSEENKKYLNSYTDFSGYVSRNTLQTYKNALKSQSGRNEKITLGEYKAIASILKIISNKSNTQKSSLTKMFISVLFPSGFFTNQQITGRSVIPIDVQKSSMFGNKKYSDLRSEFYVNNFFNSHSFDYFANKQENMSLEDIIQNCALNTYPEEMSGSKFIASFKTEDQKNAKEIIRREIISYLLSKMFSVLSSIDLFNENIKENNSLERSSSSPEIARIFANAYGLDSSLFDSCFTKNDKNNIELVKQKFVDLTKSSSVQGQTQTTIQKAFLDFGEAELFYDIFSTIYFYSGMIQKNVFSLSYSDRVVGILTDSSEFSLIQKDEERKFNDVVRFDIYNLSIDKNLIRSI